MMLIVQTGATSVRLQVFLADATVTTGAGKTGLTNASVTAYYFRDGDTTATVHTLVAGTVGTWSSGGFKEIDATNMPGWYELDIFNAVFANTVRQANVMVKATGTIVPVNIQFQLVPWNPQDAVRLGLTAIPNVAQGSTGALATGGSTGQVTVATNNDKTGYALTTTPPTAAAIAALILATPANLLATDASGRVTLIPADVPPTTAAIATAVAAAILVTPADLLSTDASGRVTPVPSTIPTSAAIATAVAAAILATPSNLLATNSGGTVNVAGSFPTVSAIAAAILATPANLLLTDGSGRVTAASTAGTVQVGSYASGQDPYTLVMETADSVDGITNAETVIQWLRIVMAVLSGVASGQATTTAIFQAITGAKARVTATVDATGDRTAVTLNGT